MSRRSRSPSASPSPRGRDRRGSRDEVGRGDKEEKGADEGSRSVLAKNLSFDVSVGDIRRLFSKYGEIRDVYMPLDHYTRRPRGFAFVEFLEARDARHAVDRAQGAELAGRKITVEAAKERRKTPEEMRKEHPPPRGRDRDSRYRSRSQSRDRRRRVSRSRSRDRDRSRRSRDRDDSRDRERDRRGREDRRRGPSRSSSRDRRR